jgi:hypothetical protein
MVEGAKVESLAYRAPAARLGEPPGRAGEHGPPRPTCLAFSSASEARGHIPLLGPYLVPYVGPYVGPDVGAQGNPFLRLAFHHKR